MARYRRAFNFDLHVDSLKKYYPKKNFRQAYRDIRKYFLNNGFVHRQGSGYVSKKPIDYLELRKILTQMWKELPWLSKCATRFDVTNVGRTYSVLPDDRGINGRNYIEEEKVSLSKKIEDFKETAKLTNEMRKENIKDVQKQFNKGKDHIEL